MYDNVGERGTYRTDGNGSSGTLHPASARIDIEIDQHEYGGGPELRFGHTGNLHRIGIRLVDVAGHFRAVASGQCRTERGVPGLGLAIQHILLDRGAALLRINRYSTDSEVIPVSRKRLDTEEGIDCSLHVLVEFAAVGIVVLGIAVTHYYERQASARRRIPSGTW